MRKLILSVIVFSFSFAELRAQDAHYYSSNDFSFSSGILAPLTVKSPLITSQLFNLQYGHYFSDYIGYSLGVDFAQNSLSTINQISLPLSITFRTKTFDFFRMNDDIIHLHANNRGHHFHPHLPAISGKSILPALAVIGAAALITAIAVAPKKIEFYLGTNIGYISPLGTSNYNTQNIFTPSYNIHNNFEVSADAKLKLQFEIKRVSIFCESGISYLLTDNYQSVNDNSYSNLFFKLNGGISYEFGSFNKKSKRQYHQI